MAEEAALELVCLVEGDSELMELMESQGNFEIWR